MRRKEQRSMLMLAIIMAFVVGVFWAGPVGAGGGNPCAAIQAVADRLGCELGESDCTDAPVEKTWQTTSYATGDDGDLQKGVAWPDPRFTDNENGTVTDNLTGLIWLKNVNRFGPKTWSDALNDCNTLAADGTILTDGSNAGDWRLPNVKELQSLIHYGVCAFALPNTAGTGKSTEGDPFTGGGGVIDYWSSTTWAFDLDFAWSVDLVFGGVADSRDKDDSRGVWPVRGGE